MYCLGNKFPGSRFKIFATVHFFATHHFAFDYVVWVHFYSFAKKNSAAS